MRKTPGVANICIIMMLTELMTVTNINDMIFVQTTNISDNNLRYKH